MTDTTSSWSPPVRHKRPERRTNAVCIKKFKNPLERQIPFSNSFFAARIGAAPGALRVRQAGAGQVSGALVSMLLKGRMWL
jgi:hypothetical protein